MIEPKKYSTSQTVLKMKELTICCGVGRRVSGGVF